MPMPLDAESLLRLARDSFGAAPDPRTRFLLQSLVTHLHRFIGETGLTHAEWHAAIAFLTAVGAKCSDERQEFMLLSDVLGVSSAVDFAAGGDPSATPGTVLGPYYSPGAPLRENGASLVDTDDGGQRLRVDGTVRSVDGRPLAGALVEVWSCASNGLYPGQDPAQAPGNLSGRLHADGEGRFAFTVLRPRNYSIPVDGPVGDLMRACARDTQRAAHVHLLVSAPGHVAVTTHLFDAACPCIEDDCVFSTRPALVRRFEVAPDGLAGTRFDVVLDRALSP